MTGIGDTGLSIVIPATELPTPKIGNGVATPIVDGLSFRTNNDADRSLLIAAAAWRWRRQKSRQEQQDREVARAREVDGIASALAAALGQNVILMTTEAIRTAAEALVDDSALLIRTVGEPS